MLSETWVWEKLQLLNRLNDTLNRLYPKDRWDADFREKVTIDFTYESNRMEGNTLTYGETIAFLKQATLPQNCRLKDILGVHNHQAILTEVFGAYNQPFSVVDLRALHQALMKDFVQWQTPDDYSPGQFKRANNVTQRPDGSLHVYTDHTLVGGVVGANQPPAQPSRRPAV